MKVSEYVDSTYSATAEIQEIDFTKAERIAGGSICDAFKVRQGVRHVFVKRLKEKYAYSPRHRAALAKEFEIGTSVNHPSLPLYLYATSDYIVMNYIDGSTLHDMTMRNDKWLSSERNIFRLINEILSIIEYLHNRGVVHCDIKPDNIIISKDTHNAVLVDLDKCYTSWLDTTSGSPGLYGVPEYEVGNPRIDFNGLGEITQTLSHYLQEGKARKIINKFIKACVKTDATPEQLHEKLAGYTKQNRTTKIIIVTLIFLLIGIAVVAALLFKIQKENIPKQVTPAAQPDAIYINTDTIVTSSQTEESVNFNADVQPDIKTQPVRHKELSNEEIERELKVVFQPYVQRCEELKGMNLNSFDANELEQIYLQLIKDFPIYIYEAQHAISKIYPSATDNEILQVINENKYTAELMSLRDSTLALIIKTLSAKELDRS